MSASGDESARSPLVYAMRRAPAATAASTIALCCATRGPTSVPEISSERLDALERGRPRGRIAVVGDPDRHVQVRRLLRVAGDGDDVAAAGEPLEDEPAELARRGRDRRSCATPGRPH